MLNQNVLFKKKSNHTEFIVWQHAGPYRSQMVPGTSISSGGRHHFITSSKLKAQVSFSDHLLSVVRSSVCLSTSHLHLLLQNYWANLNQTWHKVSFGRGNSNVFKQSVPPFSNGR